MAVTAGMVLGGSASPYEFIAPWVADMSALKYGTGSASIPGATPTPGSIPTTMGAAPTGYSSAYGGIPAVPSLGATSASAIGTNVGNIPALTGMGGAVNQFNQQQQLGQYSMYNPDLLKNLAQSSLNIGYELKGQLPQDVQDYIAQTAAERGISLGIPGSQASQYNFLRGLGLSSLDMTKLGESNLTAAMGRTPKLSLYDISSMFVTPQQQAQMQWQANMMAAAPIPASAAAANMNAAMMGMRSGSSGYGGYGGYSPYWNAFGSKSSASSYVPTTTTSSSYVPTSPGVLPNFSPSQTGKNWSSEMELYPGSGWTTEDWQALYPYETPPDFSEFDY